MFSGDKATDEGKEPKAQKYVSCSPRSLIFAWPTAKAFLNQGGHYYAVLDAEVRAANAEKRYMDPDKLEMHLPPAVCGFALGLEILLKMRSAQFSMRYRRTHRVGELFDDLPQAAQEQLEHAFAERKKIDPYQYICDYSIIAHDERVDSAAILAQPLRTVLRRADEVFVSWRYMFEHDPEVGPLSVNFYGLIHAVHALIDGINSHKGDYIFRGGSGPPTSDTKLTWEFRLHKPAT